MANRDDEARNAAEERKAVAQLVGVIVDLSSQLRGALETRVRLLEQKVHTLERGQKDEIPDWVIREMATMVEQLERLGAPPA